MKLRFACVQINPILGQVEKNIGKVRTLLSKISGPIDVVILPELAITGYNFQSRKAIEPYLETQGASRSIDLASEISKQNSCFTVIGYPELDRNTIYNSAVLVGPHGKVLHHYRKTFLYEADEAWGCSENPVKNFPAFDLILDKNYYNGSNTKVESYPSIRTNMGICMDLNPYKFKAAFNEFEFSLSCFQQKVRLILCPMAWLSPHSPSIADKLSNQEKVNRGRTFSERYFSGDSTYCINDENTDHPATSSISQTPQFIPRVPDLSTVNYWILRFFPFLKHPNSLPKDYEKVTLVTCNRVGVENDVLYGGSSSITQFISKADTSTEIDLTNPSVEVKGSLGQGEEGVLVREVDVEVNYVRAT